jgi:hypothetical protein
MEDEQKCLEKEIISAESNSIKISYTEIKFFLTEIRKGNINDMKYRKLLINVLIDKVYLYDDSITIIFNAKHKNNTKKIPRIEEIESSFLGDDALPIIRKIIS